MTSPLMTPIDPSNFAVLFAPNITNNELRDDEKLVMANLAARLMNGLYQTELRLSGLYYDGLNIVPSLGISVPPELETLRAVLGWCAAGIDARSERLHVQGFRMPGQLTVDDSLHEIWQENNMDAESVLVHEAAMIYGRAYVVVGPSDADGSPLITTESPTNMIGSWDVRNRCLSAAYQTYFDVDPASDTYRHQLATLYTRDSTVQLVQGSKGWSVQERNDHRMGFVPVVQFSCRSRIHDRLGKSEITSAWRNTQDRACRTLVRSEVSGEFFASPKVWLLGATEQAFQNSDGSLATAWETYTGRISALEADEAGNLPQVQFQQGANPDGFIASLNHERQMMAGHTGLPPQYLGIFGDGNPASADAIRMSDFRLKTTADRLAVSFGNDWENVMRMAMQVDGSVLPEEAERMETDWSYTGIPTPNADAVTVTTQIAAGMIPPDSDDALAQCGWTPVQRERIAEARKRSQGMAVLTNALTGLKPAVQPMDGAQQGALAGLNAKRSTDAASAG